MFDNPIFEEKQPQRANGQSEGAGAPAQPAVDGAASDFLDEQVRRARASLKRTRVFCVVSLVLLAGYLSFVTVTLQTRLLRPKAAADVATAYVSAVVQQQGNALSAHLVREVPAYIERLPDVFLSELPLLRVHIENQLESTLDAQSREVTAVLAEYLDEFLQNKQEDMAKLMSAAQDPALIEQFGQRVEQEVLAYFQMKGEDGESAMDKLQYGLEALQLVEARLNRLATADDLTDEEKTLRRVIAITLKPLHQGA